MSTATTGLATEAGQPAPKTALASAAASRTVHRVRVWDAPLRLFHWLLLAAVSAAIATGLAGGAWMAWHGRAGLLIVGLLAFRLVWGLVGSQTSRFAHFLPTPRRLRAYLAGAWQGVGHNPLGALSVVALLSLLALQAGTGLFSNDDIAFAGPWSDLLDEDRAHALTGWHHRLVNGLYALIGLHLAAIVFHALVKRDRLVPPMVTGWKSTARPHPAPRQAGPWALGLALAVGLASVWAASGGWRHAGADAPGVAETAQAPGTSASASASAATSATPSW